MSRPHCRPIKSQSLGVGLGHWEFFKVPQMIFLCCHGETHWSCPCLICPLSPHSLCSVHPPGLSPSPEHASLLPGPRLPFPCHFLCRNCLPPKSPLIIQFSAQNATSSLSSSLSKAWGFHLFSPHSPCPIILSFSWQLSLSNLTCVNISSVLKCKLHERRDLMFLTSVSPTQNMVGNRKLFLSEQI